MQFLTHKDPAATQRGTMPPRAYYRAGDCIPLKRWGFCYFEDEISVEEALSCRPSRTIPVPSCWEVLGYGSHQYTNARYPFPFDPPHIERNNPCGVYVTKFVRPAAEGKYYLNFDGVDSCFYLFVNGREVGYSSVPHCHSEFDVTDFLVEENEFRVVVFKFSAGSYLEDQDKLRMSGIFRDVYLLRRERGHLFDYTVRSGYDEETGEGTLCVRTDMPCTFGFLSDGGLIRASGKREFSVTIPCRPWTCETPTLYDLVIECAGETIEEKVGFRTVRAEGNVLTLNGRPIKLRGVNRHSMTERGYAETREDLERDLDLLKEMNCNAIRTSHYPPHPLLPALCDERGFYLLEEADVESHGSLFSAYNTFTPQLRDALPSDPAYREQFVSRALRMYERDKNRPSVLIWSLGNESGWGENIIAAAEALREKGDGRLLHYEGAWCNFTQRYMDGGLLDLYSRMYPELNWTEEFAKTADRPLVLCEYTHAMGNSCGDIGAYMRLFRTYPALAGGFIWEWCSHSVIRGEKVLYGGDFGEYPHDGNFCMDGIVTTDRKKNPEFYDIARVYLPYSAELEGKEIVLRNLHDFVPLGARVGKCTLYLREDDTRRKAAEYDISRIPAGGELRIPLPFGEGRGYRFAELECSDGVLFSFPLSAEPKETREENILTTSLENGTVAGLTLNGKEYLRSPMVVCMFRAPLDNDIAIRTEWEGWGLDHAAFFPLSVEEGRVYGKLAAPYLRPVGEMELLFRKEGGLTVEAKVKLGEHIPSLPRFGFVFDLGISRTETVRWFGLGPNEAYEDRKFASTAGLYSMPAGEMRYEYPKPQESGSRTETHFVAFGKEGEECLMFDSDKPFSFCVSPYLPSDFKPHRHEMRDTGHIYLFLDYRMAGVGSNSCGPRLDERYLITEREFTFRFRIRSAKDLFAAHWSKR